MPTTTEPNKLIGASKIVAIFLGIAAITFGIYQFTMKRILN